MGQDFDTAPWVTSPGVTQGDRACLLTAGADLAKEKGDFCLG